MAEGTSKRAREDALIDEVARFLDPEGGTEAQRQAREFAAELRRRRSKYADYPEIRKALEDFADGLRHVIGAARALPEDALVDLPADTYGEDTAASIGDLFLIGLVNRLTDDLNLAERVLEVAQKAGRPSDRFERYVVWRCWGLLDEWRPGGVKARSKRFRHFISLIFHLVDGRPYAEPVRAIRWAAEHMQSWEAHRAVAEIPPK